MKYCLMIALAGAIGIGGIVLGGRNNRNAANDAFESPHKKFIVYRGDTFWYCGGYSNPYREDTLFTPDGSMQIYGSRKKYEVYNAFGCEGVRTDGK
jgi:hypothetical protein